MKEFCFGSGDQSREKGHRFETQEEQDLQRPSETVHEALKGESEEPHQNPEDTEDPEDREDSRTRIMSPLHHKPHKTSKKLVRTSGSSSARFGVPAGPDYSPGPNVQLSVRAQRRL